MLEKFDFCPGISWKLTSILMKRVAKLTNIDKLVAISWDETKLKPYLRYIKSNDCITGYADYGNGNRENKPADSILIFLVKSITPSGKSWKQPLGYHLSSGPVKSNVLKKLIEFWIKFSIAIDLKPIITVCDQSSPNVKDLRDLGVSEHNPVIKIDSREIITSFDPPHILKCLRNLFLQHGVWTNKGYANPEHIVMLYGIDRQSSPKFCTKLTDIHLHPFGKQKMKVSVAAELLSYTVGSLLNILTRFEKQGLPPEANITSQFVLDVDALFDSFNGAQKRMRSSKKLRGPLHEGSPHIDFCEEIEETVKGWKILDKEGHVVQTPTIKSVLWGIAAYRKLLETFSENHVDEVFISECSQDALENLFGVAKYYAAHYHTPSPQDFKLGPPRKKSTKRCPLGARVRSPGYPPWAPRWAPIGYTACPTLRAPASGHAQNSVTKWAPIK
ncbi:uncharacterized protein LOC135940864 [Cloeon dipterum]|uniref:uncharacterized protein LOC135940864 n=1 Tax=Cloeon dipterum TaxID=197152 RepID=UPI00321FE142